ncbi:WecB/TagA/CpsF family glycosyltransferase [Thalassotalea piscium]
MKKNNLIPIPVGGIPVIPFQNIEQVSKMVVSEGGDVKQGVAIAINPEKILKSMESVEVKRILQNATIPYADGIGVVKVLEQKTNVKLSRIPGVQLWRAIVERASLFEKRVYLLGSNEETLKICVANLKAEYGTNIVGYQHGYFENKTQEIEKIKSSQADVVIIALGSPKQELFIEECRKVHHNAFYMGVGGSFDVYSGRVKRAPKCWINLNLEWLYRLLKEPKRLIRQLSLLKFVYLYLLRKL